MKSYKPIHDAFRKLNTTTVDWLKSVSFPKSQETANSIFYRDATVDASTLAYMAHCLNMSNTQIIALLDAYAKEVPKKAAEVAALKKLIAPVEMSNVEQIVVTYFRKLDDSKQALVLDLLLKLQP